MASKFKTRDPYAAIDHRVIDSPAFADLTPNAVRILLLIARQLNGHNNGQLNATFGYIKRYGIGSEHTLRNAISGLISHGFIHRTRSHGANKTWARYAVTWLSIQDKKELFLNSFLPCAWRYWCQNAKKICRHKMHEKSCSGCSFAPNNSAKSAGNSEAITADNELIPSSSNDSSHD